MPTAAVTPAAGPSADPTLVVLAAPPGPMAGVRDTLQDWSALGLIRSFVWVDAVDSGATGRSRASRIEGGRAEVVTLEDAVEEVRLERIRLAILVPAVRDAVPISPALEERLVSLIRSSSGGAPLERLRFVLTRPGSGPGTADPARPEWHNLVISPEDGQGPGRGRVQLVPSVDPIDLGAPAAATICGATGLWAGLPDAPLDGASPLPGSSVRVIRAYHRRLDAGQIEDRVRRSVTGFTDGLPRPRTGGTRSVPSDDVERDTASMAAAYWRQHAEILDSGQLQTEQVPVKPIGLGEALAMFLSFLRATLVNAVPRWYHATVHKISSDLAQRAQHALFGSNAAAYAVIVNGVRGDNEPADWRDLASTSAQLENALEQPRVEDGRGGRAVFTTLWRDLVGAALTLADAGDHPGELSPLQRGIDRAYIRDPAAIAPGSAAAFDDLPSYLPQTNPAGLRPTDVLAIESTAQQLSRLASQPAGGLDADHALSALRDWSARYRGTFTGQVGARLGEAVRRHTTVVRDLLARLAEAARTDDLDYELQRRQHRLAALIRILFGLLVVILGVDVVLAVKDVVEPLAAVLIGVGAVLAWFVGTAIAFVLQQRNLFAALHRRRQAASDAEVNQRNLAIALSDLGRTSQAYGEFLEWARIIAVVLAEPFGKRVEEARPPVLIGDGMPRSVRVGVAQPEASVLEDVVEQLRTERYHFGWLGPIWDGVLADAHRRLGPAARELRSDPSLMYSQPPGAEHLLTRWADLLEAEGLGSAASEGLWLDTLAELEHTPLGNSIVAEVTPADGGRSRTLADFLAGVGGESQAPDEFDYAVFRRQAQVAGAAAVARTWSSESRTGGLARAAVTVQFSEGLPDYDLSWTPAIEPTSAAPSRKPSGLARFDEDF
jgi:hypothetical protein